MKRTMSNMKYYTETIPLPLAEKLKEKGMPILIEQEWYGNGMPKAEKDCHKPMTKFCEVFDWLMERGILIVIEPSWDFANEEITDMWNCDIVKVGAFSSQPETEISQHDTWHEAAEKAIEKALELI